MKITDIKIIPANSFLYVKIYTDTGLHGVGESGAWGFLTASAEAIESFKTYLIGKNPLDIEHHWQYMYRCYHFRGAAVMAAISAIDIALWDIAGKHFNTPIYQLLGGKCREKIRTYYHVSGTTTEELLADCKKAIDEGFDAIGHLSPFLDEPRSVVQTGGYAKFINEAIERVALVRELVGENVDLCLELHRRMKPMEAITFAKKVEKYTPMFLEDPIIPDNFDSMAEVAAKSNVPIATGERIHTIQEYQMLFARNALSFARVSPCVCGGISGAVKIAHIAEANGALIVPHNPLSPVSSAACIQICAAVENVGIMELPNHEGMSATERYTSENKVDFKSFSQSDLVTWTPKAVKGYIDVPTAPGLGIDLVDDIENLYPFKRRKIFTKQHEDGSIVDQ